MLIVPYHFNVPKKSFFTQEWLLISLKFLLFLQNSLLVIVLLIKVIIIHFGHTFHVDEEHHDFDEEHDGVQVSKYTFSSLKPTKLAWNMAWVCTRCGFLAFLLSMATFIL
jgi:hypothetical protein